MRPILLILLLVTLPTLAYGNEVQTVSYGGLAGRAEVAIQEGRPVVQLHHVDAIMAPDTTLPLMVLAAMVDLPSGTRPSATLEIHRWVPVIDLESLHSIPDTLSSSVTAQILGTFNYAPRALITIVPWSVDGGVLYVADSLTVRISPERAIAPPQPIVVSEDRSWYDPTQPHVRVTTARDGVASISMGDVLSIAPDFEDVQKSTVALFYRGKEQPIHLSGSGQTITENTTIYFQGRHPFGDTLWMDMDDSVAVFFLTLRDTGERLRYNVVDDQEGEPLASLHLHQRIEFDTGYYHLGNAVSVDFSDYNSDLVYLEGFYWDALNGTARESNTFRYRASPAPNGSATFTAHYVSSADAAAYDPDTRADLVLNGSTYASRETDGWAPYEISITQPTESLPSGLQSLKLFSSGIDSVRNKPGYFSNILLDWYEIEMDVLPVLDSGRLNANTEVATGTTLEVWNARSNNGVTIDTLNDRISFMRTTGKGAIVRAGMTASDPTRADREWDGSTWRLTGLLRDHAVDSTAGTDLVVVIQPDEDQVLMLRQSDSETQLATSINGMPAGSHVIVYNTGAPTSGLVRDALQRRFSGTIPESGIWVMAMVADVGAELRIASDDDRAIGSSYQTRTSTSTRHVLKGALGNAASADLLIASEDGIEQARAAEAHLNDLLSQVQQSDVVIITHAMHREQAERLAEHRRSFSSVTVSVVDIAEVLDEFGAGHRSSDAVREFMAAYYAEAPVPKPHTLILFGNASWDPRLAIKGGNSRSRRADQIPTYGRPSSDYYFGLLDDPNDRAVPEMIVGRLPAATPDEGRNIVDKIIHADTVDFQSWMRRWLFVGGGVEQEGLCDHYMNLLDDPFNSGITFHDAPMCMDTATVCKYDSRANPGYDIKLNLDQGVQWMNYFGHGATDQFDIRGWEPSELINAGRYGVLATYACQTGAFSNTSVQCKNAEYVTARNVGFAAAVGGTGWEYITTISQLQYRIHEILRGSTIRNIGDLIYESKLPFAGSGQIGLNTVMQYSILGDPLMRVRMDTVPEVYLRPQQVNIQSTTGRPEITDEDLVAHVDVTIGSAGLGTTDPFETWIVREYDGTLDTLRITLHDGICLDETVRFDLPVENMPGEHRLTIIADAFQTLRDDPVDNTITTTFIVLPRSVLPIEPLPHGSIDDQAISIRVIDPLSTVDRIMEVRFEVEQDGQVVLRSSEDQVVRSGSVVDWIVDLGSAPLPHGPASVIVRARDPDTQTEAAPLSLTITIRSGLTEQHEDVVIPAARFLNQTPTTVVLDEQTGRHRLRTFDREAYVYSRGIAPSDLDNPVLQMRVGNVTYIDNPFYRGINVIVLNPFDTIPRAIRRYDTWRDPIPAEQGHDGYSNECIRFLRDSVFPGDRVLLASCNESFTGFQKDDNLEKFRTVIKALGSRFADSLAPRSSWAMIGAYGLQPGEATEAWKGAPDTIAIATQPLAFTTTAGTVSTPWIGPTRYVDSIVIDVAGEGVTSRVLGRRPDGQIIEVGTVSNGTWIPNGDEDWGTTVYRIMSDLTYTDGPIGSVGGAIGTYVEADEWLIETGDVSLDSSEALRADTVIVRARIRHARADRTSVPVSVLGTIANSSGEPVESVQRNLGFFAADERREVFLPVPTTRAPEEASVVVLLNPNAAANETYAFNNSGASVLTIREDDTPPTVLVQADGANVTEGGYVAPDPFIEVLLQDASNLPINDPSRLTVFINGDRIREEVADGVEFLPTDSCRIRYPEQPRVRAGLVFRYPLENGQNNVLVRGSDATGNEVEHECALYVTDGLTVTSITASPNPSTGPMIFRIQVQTSVRDLTGTLHLYDAKGRRIRSLESPLQLGQATLEWDGRGDAGEVLPSGMYVYRLEVSEPSIQEASGLNGTVMILR